MGLLDWLIRPTAADQDTSKFCSSQFPKLWSSFVANFTDVGFSGGSAATPEQAGVTTPLPTVLPPAPRLIAIGDLHGDLGKAKRAFRVAGLTDDRDRWVAGSTVAVQVGDVLDRGDQEIRILLFLESLQAQARAAGGALHVLNGNHETMNVMGNHRYATPGATREIERWNGWQQLAARLRASCGACQDDAQHGSAQGPPGAGLAAAAGLQGAHFVRLRALQPGSQLATRFFANHPTVLQVGSSVFVHGGVLPQHVEYGLDRINEETSAWMRGEPGPSQQEGAGVGSAGGGTHKLAAAPQFLRTASAIVWARDYSAEDAARCDCDKLEAVLKSLPGAERMVMGHTIQDQGVNAACGGRALRVDVGMSLGCGDGQVEALEIRRDGAQVLRLREGLPPIDITTHAPPQEAAARQAAAAADAQTDGMRGWAAPPTGLQPVPA